MGEKQNKNRAVCGKKECGVLCAVSSLPSPYGIGTLGKAAFDFIDLLAETGQTYWQTLPVNHTGYGDSPYAAASIYAGSPYLIDLDILVERGYLKKEQLKGIKNPEKTDYGYLYNTRFALLKKAYARYFNRYMSDESLREELKAFENAHPFLSGYAKFQSLKEEYGGAPWTEWSERDRNCGRDEEEYDFYSVTFYKFLQLQFFSQFAAVKAYANSRGIKIIGDLPIYAALDSSEVWANKQFFALDKSGKPEVVAGVPPDYFSADGQLWGNPIYNWKKIKKDGYSFWIERIRGALELYDVIRLDHFRGFEAYYAIPFGMTDGRVGEWRKGPDFGLISVLNARFGSDKFIAEDLGTITPEVRRLLKRSGYPGMKVLQFAFSFDENNPYLPKNIGYNSVVYTGTHDNDTLRGWISSLDERTKNYVCEKLGEPEGVTDERLAKAVISTCMKSAGKLVIVPVQDYLKEGAEGRMNSPSVAEGNWTWRIKNAKYGAVLKKYMLAFSRERNL